MIPTRPDMIDLGHDHWARWLAWAPDRSIPANAARFADLADDPRAALLVEHPSRRDPAITCVAAVHLNAALYKEVWAVDSFDPLTLSPSIACECGDHGFVRGGKWVPA